VVRTLVTQSRMASLIASFKVQLPETYADHFRAEHAHAGNVERLACHVFGAHVHDTFESKMRGDRGCGDAVLTRLRFSAMTRGFFHLYGEQTLPDGVV